jgi:DNA invertase Pin-like site-specific DNA recombinase
MSMREQARLWQRVSTGGQDEASQLPDLVKWCDSHGYGYDLEERYKAHGKSAWHGKHQAELDRAFADMAAGAYSVLVVWKQDRIERRGMEAALNLISRAKTAGGRIEFVTQPHLNRLNDMGSRISYAIMAEVAQAESETKSDRVKADQRRRREIGSLIGPPPWGYAIRLRDGLKTLEPTDVGRKYIPLIYDAVIAGQSLRAIAAWLDGEGVPTPRGKPWNEATIGNRLIRNPTYYGQRPNSGNLETEGLVAATTWQAANAALASRVRPGRGAKEKALLQPVCGECFGIERDGCSSGVSPMYRIDARGYPYYRCTGHGPQRKGCGFMVPVSALDELVTDEMLSNLTWHFDRVFIPGDDRSDDIAKLREQGAAAMRRGDYPAATEAMQRAGELEAMPRVPARWESRPVWPDGPDSEPLTEAAYFTALSDDERRRYLRKFVITAHRADGEAGFVMVPAEMTV